MAFLFDSMLIWIGQKVKEMVDQEIYEDEGNIQERLLALQTKLEDGKISEDEYRKAEERLLEQLEVTRTHKTE